MMTKLLFLTNNQCRQLDLSNLQKFTQAMDINPQPKLVINLLQSYVYDSGANVSSEKVHWSNRSAGIPDENDINGGYSYSELGGEQGITTTDRKIAIFLRDAVLPVAIQTNAIVLVNVDCCSLSKAWGELVAEETSKRGGRIPFTVINVGFAADYDSQSQIHGTIAYQLRLGSKRWRQSQRRIHSAVESSNSKWRINWPQYIVPPVGCSHYIIADSVNDKKNSLDFSAGRTLSKNLTEAFAKTLPSIGFVTLSHQQDLTSGALSLSNYVGRGLPLLILDSRDRPVINNLEEAEAHLHELEAELNKEGHIDFYRDSNWSLLHTVLNRIVEQELLGKNSAASRNTNGLEIFRVLEAHVAKERSESVNFSGQSKIRSTSKASSTVAAIQQANDIVHQAVNIVMRMDKVRQANDEKIRTEFELKYLEQLPEPKSFDELDEILFSECQRWALNRGELTNRYSVLLKDPNLFTSKALWKARLDGKCKAPWCEVIVCNREDVTFEDVKAAWLGLIESFKGDKQVNFHSNKFRSKVFMACIELLSSPKTHSCNLNDLETIKATIKRVAKTDRFPQKNTIEGFQILQSTWDKVDIFNEIANRHKSNAKRAYFLLLLLGAAVTITTVVSINYSGYHCTDNTDDIYWTQYTDSIIVTLTLTASVVAALVAYSNPGTKWQQLRGATLALESEIWKFRTRTGEYGAAGQDSGAGILRNAELKLQNYAEVIKQHVVKSATVMNTR